jgi:hypothetical protein
MFSRLLNLLRHGSKRPLSKDEISEIAREINRPILEPLQKPSPPGFTSSQRFIPADVATRVGQISWFFNCGNPLAVDLTMAIQRVDSWTDAAQLCRKQESDDAQLNAQNQLTIWLSRNARDDYQKWNDRVRAFKASVISPLVEAPVRDYCLRHGVDEVVVQNARWDLLGALMENEYLFTGHSAFYFLELLKIYEAGHFPCGWSGVWPDGELYVF